MVLSDEVVDQEVRRLWSIKVSDPRVIERAMAKAEMLRDLDIIDYDEYADLYDRLAGLKDSGKRRHRR